MLKITPEIKKALNYELKDKMNKTGKRKVWFPTVNGKRLTKTNFFKKWESEQELQKVVNHFGIDYIMEYAKK